MGVDRERLLALARGHDGVLTAAQLESAGIDRSWVHRQVRAGHWQRLHPGVYVTHSGPLAWRSRARAALQHAGTDAALSHLSAAFLHGWTPAPAVLDVSVPHGRRVVERPGLRIHRRRLLTVVRGRLTVVPRGDTVIDLVGMARSVDDAVAVVTAAVRNGTRPDEVLEAAGRRSRVRRRALLHELLDAAAQGVESALELRYHRDVERRHGLPRAALQQWQRLGDRWARADAIYVGTGVRVELDGRVAHEGRVDDDVWRDNAVVVAHSELTLRYRWSHVAGAPCGTAAQVVSALRSRGWTGTPRACGPSCPVR
ncbi:type IV toxin-antitoxin system AbiEi family antitoxin domain-containing protein [Actinotalea sp. Marseille-Q4924]|uniref:type IV toxin-antitoxin system AbiEi family antitoxin domain-containing protein n=1 Tax=Actinotalea sp. Marseille-Q4924 TaxID=2866571 RepID=UPI001CE480F3|nr:type IV toxin-antitoxin system AbiEi family antitoxin domain-containing protein [Actinotalea sp. Marseille-Q4924]